MPELLSKKILIVPLDWGLGHTTRCIPLISVMCEQGINVHVGGTTVTNALLKKEFPGLTFHDYPSYGVSYTTKASMFLWQIIKQLPKVTRVVKKEGRITKKLNAKYKYDVIISDNRFGVHDVNTRNLFITHQLNVLVPQLKVLERLTNYFNHNYINKFDKIMVPDTQDHLLSGLLTNEKGIKKPLVYLGNLSRWGNIQAEPTAKKQRVLAMLSGPEPQRTLLENKLIKQHKEGEQRLTIVRAKPNEQELPQAKDITFFNHLRANELQQLVLESDVIISRAGYSTIMDLVAVKKHAILIPTPGQTEQEYLSNYLAEKQLFHFYTQDEFFLSQAISTFRNTQWQSFPVIKNKIKEILLDQIK